MIRRFLKSSALYAMIEGVQKGFLFLVTPILTYHMSPDEFGVVSSSLMVISFISIFLSLSLHGSISRFYHRYEGICEEKFISSIFIFLTVFLSLSFVVLLCISPFFFGFIFSEISYYPYAAYILIISSSQPIIIVLFSLLKIKQDFKFFSISYNAYFFVQITLLLSFVIPLNLGAEGYLLALVISNVIFCILTLFYVFKCFGFGFDLKYIKESLSYSIPILPVDLLSLINGLVDRYFILIYLGLAPVGLFYIGVQISALIRLVTLAINSAYVPIFFRALESKESNYRELYKLADFFVLFSCGLFVFVALFSGDFIRFFYSKEYFEIIRAIPLMAFNAAISSIYIINTNVLSISSKLVKIKTVIIFLGVAVNALLSFFLTPLYGLVGAALSTLLTSLIIIIAYVLIVINNTSFKFDICKYFTFFGVSFVVVNWVLMFEYFDGFLYFIIKLITLFTYIFVAYLYVRRNHMVIS